MNTEQLRTEFEAAYAAEFQFAAGRPGKFDLDANDDYEDVQVLVGWRMWQAGRAALQSQDREDAYDIEAAAKTLAECMDYPWESMPEKGREAMRKFAKRVIDRARRVEGES